MNHRLSQSCPIDLCYVQLFSVDLCRYIFITSTLPATRDQKTSYITCDQLDSCRYIEYLWDYEFGTKKFFEPNIRTSAKRSTDKKLKLLVFIFLYLRLVVGSDQLDLYRLSCVIYRCRHLVWPFQYVIDQLKMKVKKKENIK